VAHNAENDGGMKDFMEAKLFRPRVWTLRSEDGGAAKVGRSASNESD
jgi:hypothetical protein